MENSQKVKWYKRLTILLTVTTLIPTALLLMAMRSSKPNGDRGTIVTQTTATQYLNNYRNTATVPAEPIQAFIVESGQLDAMNNILKQNAGTTKYRIYFGIDNAGSPISLVVGLRPDGTDMSLPIYSSSRTGTNLCPPMCDMQAAFDVNE